MMNEVWLMLMKLTRFVLTHLLESQDFVQAHRAIAFFDKAKKMSILTEIVVAEVMIDLSDDFHRLRVSRSW